MLKPEVAGCSSRRFGKAASSLDGEQKCRQSQRQACKGQIVTICHRGREGGPLARVALKKESRPEGVWPRDLFSP
ncbi:hypothetical protein NL676_011368 [Syzygium grande]|nr:hypothetical protein NL676_011368 [Syzygium grande]